MAVALPGAIEHGKRRALRLRQQVRLTPKPFARSAVRPAQYLQRADDSGDDVLGSINLSASAAPEKGMSFPIPDPLAAGQVRRLLKRAVHAQETFDFIITGVRHRPRPPMRVRFLATF